MTKIRSYIDIGANLTDLMYRGIYNGSKRHEPDLDSVLKRSWDAGLNSIIITGGNLEESRKALELSQSDERLYTTVGCHPTRCGEFLENPQEYYKQLEETVEKNCRKVVAIGECGLDYDRIEFCPIETQKKYFERQLSLSKRFNLPLFLHCRNSAQDLYDILSKHSDLRGVVHSFDGTLEEAQKFINLGYHIGLNGCSLKTKENLETVSKLPEDKILLETDSPWCEIRPSHAGFPLICDLNKMATVKKEKWRANHLIKSRNKPCNIRQVLDIIAGVRKQDGDVLSAIIMKNTTSLFFSDL